MMSGKTPRYPKTSVFLFVAAISHSTKRLLGRTLQLRHSKERDVEKNLRELYLAVEDINILIEKSKFRDLVHHFAKTNRESVYYTNYKGLKKRIAEIKLAIELIRKSDRKSLRMRIVNASIEIDHHVENIMQQLTLETHVEHALDKRSENFELRKLQKCDVLISFGVQEYAVMKIYSKLTRELQKLPATHSEIVIQTHPSLVTIDAQTYKPSGLVAKKFLPELNTLYIVLRPRILDWQSEHIARFIRERLDDHKKYGWGKLWAIGFRYLLSQKFRNLEFLFNNPKYPICSSFIAEAFEHVHIPIKEGVSSSLISPGDLLSCDVFSMIGMIYVRDESKDK